MFDSNLGITSKQAVNRTIKVSCIYIYKSTLNIARNILLYNTRQNSVLRMRDTIGQHASSLCICTLGPKTSYLFKKSTVPCQL